MYLALYRKWRPRVFSDVVSQEHITRTLQNQIRTGRTAHAYLFTGSRGTGKTTCSKILAKAVNCLHPVDGNPCLECSVCKGIEDGSILDVVEMDAASNNSVDDVRELRDEASYAPSVCKYRVYIIDEVHMLSTSAFNALLKIMEEPPPHVLFILATTEVHKVPQTIVSRCQQYDFRRIRPADSARRMLEISEQEEFTLEPDAAALIARLADGGMRDALSLLDQCAAFSDHIDLRTVADTAGIAGSEHLFALSGAILQKDAAAAISKVGELYDNAKGVDRLVSELIGHFRNVMLCKSVADPQNLVVCLPDEMERFMALAKALPLSRILEILAAFQRCLDALSRSGSKKVELEMTLIRLCASPEPAQTPPELAQRLEKLERQAAQTIAPAPPKAPVSEAPVSRPASDPAAEGEGSRPMAQWEGLLGELSRSEPALYVMLEGSRAYISGGIVLIESPNPMLKSLLLTDNIGAKLADVVEQTLGRRYRLRITKREPNAVSGQTESALDHILQKAKEQNIEVHES
ncbi:MAG: DNA polymerase III subunit gamma/tau [Candidatus Merdivicinus sp.]|jgi:DNA polymerase-3 subunit gamma/tau